MGERVFDIMAKILETEGKAMVENAQGIYCWTLSKGDKTRHWLLDLKNGNGSIKEASSNEGNDVELVLAEGDFLKMLKKEADAMNLFMSGGLKIEGDMSLAMKLEVYLHHWKAKPNYNCTISSRTYVLHRLEFPIFLMYSSTSIFSRIHSSGPHTFTGVMIHEYLGNSF